MNSSVLCSLLFGLALLLCSCAAESGPAAEDDHAHGGGTAVTIWTDQSELFFEYPPLIAGLQSAPWAIHVTRMDDFSPVTEGSLTLAFRDQEGTVYTTRSEEPARPGIYTPGPTLPAPGTYDLVVAVDGPRLTDRIRAGRVEVVADSTALPHEEEVADESISFLKEQQWSIDFAVVEARADDIQSSVPVSGTIRAASGRSALVTAPVSGLARADINLSAPAEGQRVTSGDLLVTLLPASGEGSFAQVRATAQHLEREVGRLERLFEAGAVPEKRLLEAQNELEVARATLSAMDAPEGEGFDYPVRTPLGGIVHKRFFTPGQRVEPGDPLYHIVDPSEVWLEIHLPARYASQASDVAGVSFTVEGSNRLIRSDRIVSIGVAVDPDRRTLPVIVAVNNANGSLKIGQIASGQILLENTEDGVVLPQDAIQLEDGQQVVYVQTGGESFERRLLQVGATDGSRTLVRGGVADGEYVVTRGAYQVYLASLSTNDIGDHGHPH
jgi:RND family efflux transporter MFP subunit